MGTHPYFTDKCKISMACMWKTIWWFLKKVNIKLLYYPTIPLLSILPEELKTSIQTNTCTGIFIVALFSITEMWKLPICPLTDEWIHKMWYIYTHSAKYYSTIKRDNILTHATMWMNLENIMLSEISQTQKNNMI